MNVFRLIGTRGEWLELETVQAAYNSHCYSSEPTFSRMRLRLFAKTSGRAQVSSEVIESVWKDGTSIRLAKGTSLVPLSSKGIYAAHVKGFAMAIKAPTSAIGSSYSSPNLFNVASSGEELHFKKVKPVPRYGTTATLDSRFDRSLNVLRKRERGDNFLVTARFRCGEITVLAPRYRVDTRDETERLVHGGILGDPPTDISIASGAKAAWANGEPAGEILESVRFQEEVAGHEGRRCFRNRLALIHPSQKNLKPRNYLTLCFDGNAVLNPTAKE